MAKVSIVIPSRNEKYLQKTINSLLENAEGDIEIIAVLDGYWPEPYLSSKDRVVIVHFSESKGMRAAINGGVAIARGEYIMKLDAHCIMDKGFDKKLVADCQDNWVVIPRRKRLDVEKWRPQTEEEAKKPDVDYEYLSFPDNPHDFGGASLHGRPWNERSKTKKDELISDNIAFQGSCWFMKKDYFYSLELMDEENYGKFANEAQEIGLKAWLSGGRVVTNKKTWYAHWHKGKTEGGRGYFLDNRQLRRGAEYTKKWVYNEAWDKQKIPFAWLIDEKFPGMPGWGNDWKEKLNYK